MSSLFRKLLAACLLVAGMTGASFAQTSAEAKPYVSQDGHFHITLPGEPAVSTQTITTASGSPMDVHILTVGNDASKVAFLVMYGKMPDADIQAQNAGGLTDEDRLSNFMDGFLKSLNGKATSERSLNLAGAVGKEVEFERADGTKGVYRNYVLNGRVYELIVGWNGVTPGYGDVSGFLDSFAIDN